MVNFPSTVPSRPISDLSSRSIHLDDMLEQERKAMQHALFLRFEDKALEADFVQEVIVDNMRKQKRRYWWPLAMCIFLAFHGPAYIAGDWLVDGEVTAAAICVIIIHCIQLLSLSFLLVMRCKTTQFLDVDACVLLVGGLFCTTLPSSNAWRAGRWYAGDDHFFWRHGSGLDSDVHIITFMIGSQIVVNFSLPVRSRLSVYYAIFVPVLYFVSSFPRGWSPHSRLNVFLHTGELCLLAFGLWVGHLAKERRRRVEWLRVKALGAQNTYLRAAASMQEPSNQAEDLALRRLRDSIRWQKSEEITSAQKALLELGWNQSDIEARITSIRKYQSETFGVSVQYLLSTEFTRMAQEKTAETDPNFYQISKAIFYGSSAVGNDLICPRDQTLGCSFLDTLPPQDKGPCTHFLSWSWSYTLSIVQDALSNWIEVTDRRPQDIHLWMCFFVNNQHRILNQDSKVMEGSDDLEKVFEVNLRRIGKVVALLDTWINPSYLSRIWCIFEQFTAIKLELEVSMIMPRATTTSFLQQIEQGKQGILNLKENLSKVDSQNARASVLADENKVKQLIQASIGFEKVNKCIIDNLIKWMALEVQNVMANLVHNRVPEHGTRCVRVHEDGIVVSCNG